MTGAISPFRHTSAGVLLLDQRRLPDAEVWLPLNGPADGASAIAAMVVRGAPAIGITAAHALAALGVQARDGETWRDACARLLASRPTAVNLAWAVARMDRCRGDGGGDVAARLRHEAGAIEAEDLAACRRIGAHGAQALHGAALTVLTHCNAGALATAGWGTALGVIRELHARGRLRAAWATETRPFGQGARLTTWELRHDRIPHTLIADVAAGAALAQGRIDAVVVGADRIAMDGAAANKIGTYTLAVLAQRHGVPFLVAAPWSTVDPRAAGAHDIPVEERDGDEVRTWGGVRLVPAQSPVWNPAFDVTPPQLISAIVTDRGTVVPPFGPGLAALAGSAS